MTGIHQWRGGSSSESPLKLSVPRFVVPFKSESPNYVGISSRSIRNVVKRSSFLDGGYTFMCRNFTQVKAIGLLTAVVAQLVEATVIEDDVLITTVAVTVVSNPLGVVSAIKT